MQGRTKVTMFIGLSESKVGEEGGKGMTNREGTQKRGRMYRRLLYGSETIPCPVPTQKTTWVHVMLRQAAAALSRALIELFGYSFVNLSESKGSEEEREGMTNGEGTQKRGRMYRRLLYGSVTISCPVPMQKTTWVHVMSRQPASALRGSSTVPFSSYTLQQLQ